MQFLCAGDLFKKYTEVSDILQISGGMLTNVSKKRKIEEGNLQEVKVTILRHQNIQRLMLSLQLVHACSSSGDQVRERPPGGFFSLGEGQTRRGRTVRSPDTSMISTYPSGSGCSKPD